MLTDAVDFSEAAGLVLYHGLASTCSKKVRITLMEKGLPFASRLIHLQKFEQFDPRYLAINPGGVVPSLVVDGAPVVESSVICEFLEDRYPETRLRPADPLAAARMRVMTRYADTFAYDAVYQLTWMRLSAPAAQRLSSAELAEMLKSVPTQERRERWETVARDGFSAKEIEESLSKMRDTLGKIDGWAAGGPWLLGEQYSLADISLIPFVHRIVNLAPEMLREGSGYAALSGWYERMLARPAVHRALFFTEDPRAADLPNV
jgi:glutathione S-transferase